MSAWDEIADLIAERALERAARPARFTVAVPQPLRLEQIDGNEALEDGDDDVSFGDGFRQYVANYALDIGDVVLAYEIDGIWTIVDVESDRQLADLKNPDDPTGGGRSKFVQAIPLATWTIDYTGLYPPAVTVAVDGEEVGVDLVFLEAEHRVLVKFFAPTAGVAYLS